MDRTDGKGRGRKRESWEGLEGSAPADGNCLAAGRETIVILQNMGQHSGPAYLIFFLRWVGEAI